MSDGQEQECTSCRVVGTAVFGGIGAQSFWQVYKKHPHRGFNLAIGLGKSTSRFPCNLF